MNSEIANLIEQAWELLYKDTDKTLEISLEAQRRSEQLSDRSGIAYSLRNLGVCSYMAGDYQIGVERLTQAISIFNEEGDKAGLSSARNWLANQYWRLGDFQKSLKHHFENLYLRKELGIPADIAGTLNNIGLNYLDLGQFDAALDYFLQAKNQYEAAENLEGLGQTLNNISHIYDKLDDNEKSLEFRMQSLEIRRKLGNKVGEISCLTNIGNTHRHMKNYQQAIDLQSQALKLARDLKNKSNEAMILMNLANIYADQEEYDKALEGHLHSYKMLEEIGDTTYQVTCLINIGTDHTRRGAPQDGLPYLMAALKKANENQSTELEYQVHKALASLYEAQQDFKTAFEHIQYCFEFREKMFSAESEQKIKSTLIKVEVEHSQREAEIYRAKNLELEKANQDISELLAIVQQKSDALERLTLEDELTCIPNRRFLTSRMQEEFERSCRFHHPTAIAMVDVDNFKSINDRFGHRTGDDVLKQLAKILKEGTRSVDIIGRYGGEEFTIMFVEMPPGEALNISERIRKTIQNHPWETLQPDLQVTVSIGLTLSAANSVHAMLEKADQNLYIAKREGKNRVHVSS